MSTRTLELLVKGQAGSGQAALRGLAAEARVAAAQVSAASASMSTASTGSANKVVKSWSKLVRSTASVTGISKGAARGVGQVGTSFLAASGTANALGSAVSILPGGFGLAAAAAVGAAVAILKLRDGESAAEAQTRRLTASLVAVGQAHAQTEQLVLASADAQTQWVSSARSAPQLQEHLVALQRAYNNAVQEFGSASPQALQRLAELRQGQADAARGADAFRRAQHDIVASTKDTGAAFEKEVGTLRSRETVLRTAIRNARLFGVGAKDLAQNERELAQVQDAIAGKSRAAAQAHLDQGQKLRDLANVARNSASPAVRDTAAALEVLANQQFSAAGIIGGLRNIASQAAAARDGVLSIYAAIASGNIKVPGPGGGGKKDGKSIIGAFGGSGSAIVKRNRPGLSVADQAREDLGILASNDSLQDKAARSNAESVARKGGATNDEYLALVGEKAVTDRRLKENKQRQNVVKKALVRVRGQITGKIKARDGLRAKRRKVPKGSKEFGRLTGLIDKIKSELDSLYADERGLIQDGAELQAEASELGFDSSTLQSEITNTKPVLPTDGGGGGSDGAVGGASSAEAAVALADLTPGTADDISTREGLLAERQAELEQAKARGDNNAIVQLASSILSLMDEIARLRGAVTDNTAATQAASGSTAFQFRGQGYYLGMGRGQSSDSLLDVGVGV